MSNFELSIRNFGPINESKIDISKSIMLIGKNSTGKSFTALLLHSFLNIYDIDNFDIDNKFSQIRNQTLDLVTQNKSDLFEKYSVDFKNHINSKSNSFVILKNELDDLINSGIGEYYSYLIEERLKKVFNVKNLDDLIKNDKNFFEIKYKDIKMLKERNKNFKLENFSEHIDISDILNKSNNDIFTIKKNNSNNYEINIDYSLYPKFDEFERNVSFKTLYSHMAINIFNSLNPNKSFYIPSARDELLKNKNTYLSQNLRGRFSFSPIQKELAYNLLDINTDSKKEEFYTIANTLENDILDGEINVEYIEPNTEFYFENLENNINLSFNLVSSEIRELSPLILYLKYILKKDDILIIEEPEAHLHPFNQVKLVKYIVKAINNGLNIIITTHSDFILDQFNNHIRLNNVSEEKFKDKIKNYTKEDSLDFNKINIYKFRLDSPFNTSSKKVEINETGFDEDTFSKVSSVLYDDSIKIIESKEGW